MNTTRTLTPLAGAFALAALTAAATGTPIYEESFDTADAIADWTGEPQWSATDGNPGGAVIVANNVQPTNKNFTVRLPLDFEDDSDITVTFDALILTDIAGVFHFYIEPEGFPQFFINFNVEALINSTSHTSLTFVAKDVPAEATYVDLRFEMITGAVLGADISVAIDNLKVAGPHVDPEGTWKGYTLVDEHWVDMAGQLGWVYVTHDPWLYSSALEQWVYLPPGTFPGVSAIWFFMLPSE
ncbi:MAG: hypothetical protein JJU00_09100 [Opitutales bacterium]|nr:hypothetical protein [Opitutales bacterium]